MTTAPLPSSYGRPSVGGIIVTTGFTYPKPALSRFWTTMLPEKLRASTVSTSACARSDGGSGSRQPTPAGTRVSRNRSRSAFTRVGTARSTTEAEVWARPVKRRVEKVSRKLDLPRDSSDSSGLGGSVGACGDVRGATGDVPAALAAAAPGAERLPTPAAAPPPEVPVPSADSPGRSRHADTSSPPGGGVNPMWQL
eukprot:scaffold10071_cov90-Isochrysis_galbana.AAC.2